ncbi:SIMPL domain-containing protein [Aquimarina sp. AU58]|uniref:SIMPL domain-containing protein n=1 Tax=Aquimarina sp. AU58 TaxID=1874112 RepID=UPI00135922B4|nr:SIMPL domain-containing protein [Aquimarina sp. AU58]
MNKIIYLFILTINITFAQNGFIEIEVKDSIRIKPINFEYNVQISESKFNNLEFAKTSKDSAKFKMQEKYKELESFLLKKKYKIRPLNNSEYQIHEYVGFWKLGFAVKLKNSKELEELTTELKTLDYITGSIGEIEYGNSELYEKRLFTKILKKAKRKGQMVAELIGQKLGKIVELKEGKEAENISVNIRDVYLSALQQKKWDVNKNILFGQEWKTVIVKYTTE